MSGQEHQRPAEHQLMEKQESNRDRERLRNTTAVKAPEEVSLTVRRFRLVLKETLRTQSWTKHLWERRSEFTGAGHQLNCPTERERHTQSHRSL